MANAYKAAIATTPFKAAHIRSQRVLIPLALLALYFIWGSTYLAIGFLVQTFPPFYGAGVRFLGAGILLFAFLKARGAPWPSWREWAGAAIVGGLLLAGGNGFVSYAEQSVASGLTAVLIATVPLWAAVFARLWGQRPTRPEVIGLVVGFAGVGLLNAGTSLSAHPIGAIILILAAASWAFGSVWSRYLKLPAGVMSSATQMLAGGCILMVLGLISGEHVSRLPSQRGMWALLYLIFIGSLVAYVSYVYLLRTVRPTLATSYAYVNPAVAVGLGIVLNGERMTFAGGIALVVILAAVCLVVMGKRSQ